MWLSTKEKISKYDISKINNIRTRNGGDMTIINFECPQKDNKGNTTYIKFKATLFEKVEAVAKNFDTKEAGDRIAIYGANKVELEEFNGKYTIVLICNKDQIEIFDPQGNYKGVGLDNNNVSQSSPIDVVNATDDELPF